MPKIFRWIGFAALFVFSFFIFLYWSFPYDILKDRLITAIEQQLGADYDVKIADFSPSFFTGATLKGVKVIKHDGEHSSTIYESSKIKVRASLGTLLFGKVDVSFYVKGSKGEIEGEYSVTDDGFLLSGELSDFNIGDLGFILGGGSAKLSSAINGSFKFNINNRQMIQSTGMAEISLDDIAIKAGDLKFSETSAFTLPELLFSKGSGSSLKFELNKGVVKVQECKLEDGDLKLDLTGDVFMSSVLKNYRMNLKGVFSVTPKFEQALPVFFMVEKQKQADGSYPLTLTGRLGQPSIKIGDFTLPL